jgi:predicted metalloprotease with PDZ domain
MKTKLLSSGLLMLSALSFALSAPAEPAPIKLEVDATDAPRNLLHARLLIPAQPGKLTLRYPKWIPGEHGPTGPINDLVGLKFSAGGKPLDWQRDPDDMFAFHLNVPPGADAVDASLDFLLPAAGAYSAGVSSTAKLLDLSWNQVLLYPERTSSLKTAYSASLRLPDHWEFGTALPIRHASDSRIQFSTVSLETLVDSPVIAGEYFRTVDLSPGSKPGHFLHMVADAASDLEIKPEDIGHFRHLVSEANALFGAHHYTSYHFLLTLSDRVAHFGLEHHESSDDRVAEKFLTDEDTRRLGASLLPHEMVHSWNGKYRRPAGLATSDYSQAMQDDLLWVYEGLTTYYGNVLAVRSGLWTNADFRDDTAYNAATLDSQPGRDWRPLSDTTAAAQLLYEAPGEGASRRRRVDFYPEGVLIWLEADTIIRQQSKGRLSLDDFCRVFYGGESGPPKVIPYTLDELTGTLNTLAPYDWHGFFQKRIYEINPRAPLGGIENGGGRLAYTNRVTTALKSRESARKYADMSFSLGLVLHEDGQISDVIPGSPADKAGVGFSMKLIAVNSRAWTPDNLRAAVTSAITNHAPIELLIENSDYFKTYKVDYHGGEKYPGLERDPAKTDVFSEILKPLTPEPSAN